MVVVVVMQVRVRAPDEYGRFLVEHGHAYDPDVANAAPSLVGVGLFLLAEQESCRGALITSPTWDLDGFSRPKNVSLALEIAVLARQHIYAIHGDNGQAPPVGMVVELDAVGPLFRGLHVHFSFMADAAEWLVPLALDDVYSHGVVSFSSS